MWLKTALNDSFEQFFRLRSHTSGHKGDHYRFLPL
jgi:hypothetical protein